jgi:hypothetical protein
LSCYKLLKNMPASFYFTGGLKVTLRAVSSGMHILPTSFLLSTKFINSFKFNSFSQLTFVKAIKA